MDRAKETLAAIIGSDSMSTAGQKIGLSTAAISRQMLHGKVQAKTLIALAHAYDKSAIDALIDAGFLTPKDIAKSQHIAQYTTQNESNHLTKQQLLAILEQRITS